jgi:hypothetical protein
VLERTKEGDDHYGWVFPKTENEVPGAQPDPLYGARSIRELYEIANPNYTGRYTVPVNPTKHSPFLYPFLLIRIVMPQFDFWFCGPTS